MPVIERHRSDPRGIVAALTPKLADFEITRIADITGLDRLGIPVVTVVRPKGIALGVSQGKGLDSDSAIASGLMESLEAWGAERCTQWDRYSSMLELAEEGPVLDVVRLPKRRDRKVTVTTQLPWVEGTDLMNDGERIWVPLPLVHLAFGRTRPPGTEYVCASSNGLACGTDRDGALVHALCEVVERDALAIWHGRTVYERAATKIDMSTIDYQPAKSLLEQIYDADMAVALFNAGSDVNMPVIHAEIVEKGESMAYFFPQPSAGDACHPDPGVAIVRALLEAVQSRLTLIAGLRDDISYEDYHDTDHIGSVSNADSSVSYRDLPVLGPADSATMIQTIAALLKNIGTEQIAVVDIPMPADVPVNIVRVIVPGLETKVSHPAYLPGTRALKQATGWRFKAS